MTRPTPTSPVLAALLAGLFDDAGMFPPASLPLEDALAGHEASRTGSWSWMLGRFVCPAARIGMVPPALRVSLLVAEASEISGWRPSGGAVVESVECGPADPDPQALRAACDAAGVEAVFLEVAPLADDVLALAGTGVGAKIRCGGAGPAAATPPAVAVSDAVFAAVEAGVPLKATAGLHHPFRHRTADGAPAHGFLNLLAAVGAAMAGADQATVLDVLEETDPTAFTLGPDRFGWESWTIDARGARRVRSALLTSIGTCSFTEPLEDLVALGLVP